MKSFLQGVLLLVLALTVKFSAADDATLVAELCRFRIGIFPHPNPELCYNFVICAWFDGVVQECAPGEIFVDGEFCVPGNRITCEREDPIETTTQPNLENICDGIPDMTFLPDPRSCTKFVLCLQGNAQFLNCFHPEPIFDPSRSLCVAGNAETCEIYGVPTPPPITTLTPPTPEPTTPTTQAPNTDPPITFTEAPPTPPIGTTTTTGSPVLPPLEVCRGTNFRFVADPTSCYRYFLCVFGLPIAGECDPDRIFEQALQGCVRGDQQTCTRANNVESITINPPRRT